MTKEELLDYGIIIPEKWDIEYFRYLVNLGYKVAIEDMRYNIIYLLGNESEMAVSMAFPNSIFNITDISSFNKYVNRIQFNSIVFITKVQALNELMEVNLDDPYFKHSKLKVLWYKFLNKIY